MKTRRIFSGMLAGVLLLSMTACGEKAAAPEDKGKEKGAAADVKIGLLIPGSPTDGGFCQLAADAGKQLEETYGYTVSVVEISTGESIKQEGEEMAADGYKVVLGHSGQTVVPLSEISGDYPDTYFITSGGELVTKNQFPLCMCLEEVTYVAGVVAGLMTKSNIIGYTVGGDYPNYVKTTNGFELGAKSVNPDVTVLGSVLSSTNANDAYEATLNQISMGADFIISNSNEGQSGAIKAVEESPGVYTFGLLGDFTEQSPEHVVASLSGDWQKGFIQSVTSIVDGTLKKPEIKFMTLANDCISYHWNEAIKAKLPPEVVAQAEQVMQDIRDGKIHVPNEYELG